jgi:hypothetical protein
VTTIKTSSGRVTEVLISGDTTLAPGDRGFRFVALAALTITVPTPGVLGNGFTCQVVNDSGGDSVVIDGVNATDATLLDGDIATLYETNGKQRVTTEASVLIGDVTVADRLWDPSVFGLDYDLVHWWDATSGVTLGGSGTTVRSWADVISGMTPIQVHSFQQGTWPNSDEIRFDGHGLGLEIPNAGRAGYESKWWLFLFRVNWTAMASSTDTFFFDINGNSNGNGQKQPQLQYKHLTHEVSVNWYSDGGLLTQTIAIPGADDTWHSLICRRTDDHIYVSVDGAAESSLACYPRAFLDTGAQPVGSIGTTTGTGAQTTSIGFDTLLWGQREISASEIAKAHAWALWKRGAEASLDAGSPYLLAPPMMALIDRHVAPPDSYADGYIFPLAGDPGGWDDTIRGSALNLTGYTRTFHDHFTSLSTVTDGLTGAGPWYAPAHIDTSGAKFRRTTQLPSDTFTLSDATTLQIKMQKLNTDPLSTVYASGHIQSVDSWRNGFTQAVPTGGSSYFEARLAFNGVGTDVDGNTVSPAPGWPAFWLYTPLDARDSAATKAEVDIVEAYGDRSPSVNELHIAGHRHAAYRPQPGNAGSPGNSTVSHSPSKILDMTASPWNVTPSLFDGTGPGSPGTFHTYGAKIDATWITWYFDGLAVSRFPTFKEALGPLYMLISFQSQDLVLPSTPNCTTYLWVDYVDAWSHS